MFLVLVELVQFEPMQFGLAFTGLVVQVKPPLLVVNGQTEPGPTACQFGGNCALAAPPRILLFGCDVGGFSQSVQSIQLALVLLVPLVVATLTVLAKGTTEI